MRCLDNAGISSILEWNYTIRPTAFSEFVAVIVRSILSTTRGRHFCLPQIGVSSSDQSTDTQVQKLKAAGCQVVRTEKLSGKSREGRDQLATLLEFIGPGDVLVCVKLDRLGRSTRDVLISFMSLTRRGRFCVFWNPPFRPMGP